MTLDRAVLAARASAIFSQLANKGHPTGKTLAEGTDLSPPDAGDLMFAISITFAALMDLTATAGEFIEIAADRLFDAASRPAAEIVAKNFVESRAKLQAIYNNTTLASAVLPSLDNLSIAVDLRVRIEDGKVARGTPVAVLHFDTDVTGHQLWLQLNKTEVQFVIDRLKITLEEMTLAENLLDGAKEK